MDIKLEGSADEQVGCSLLWAFVRCMAATNQLPELLFTLSRWSRVSWKEQDNLKTTDALFGAASTFIFAISNTIQISRTGQTKSPVSQHQVVFFGITRLPQVDFRILLLSRAHHWMDPWHKVAHFFEMPWIWGLASASMAAVTRKSLLVLMLSNLGNIYYLATIFMRRGS